VILSHFVFSSTQEKCFLCVFFSSFANWGKKDKRKGLNFITELCRWSRLTQQKEIIMFLFQCLRKKQSTVYNFIIFFFLQVALLYFH